MKRLVIVTGPTASGKTALAVQLARRFGGEVVSADSMQIYRGMDIGTAKPSAEEMDGVPHHMLNVAEPDENYSVSRYRQEASEAVDGIFSRGKLPVVCGGTGLYIEGLVRGGGFAAKSDDALRKTLEERFDAEGGGKLLAELAGRDPVSALKLHPNDKKRIVRALEVLLITGEGISVHNARTKAAPPRYRHVGIWLNIEPRSALYERIDRRVDAMLDAGLVGEVRRLLEGGRLRGTAAQSIGYKELAEYIEGRAQLGQAAAAIKQNSRNYAKRQLTWLRRDSSLREICWDGRRMDDALANVTNFLLDCGLKLT